VNSIHHHTRRRFFTSTHSRAHIMASTPDDDMPCVANVTLLGTDGATQDGQEALLSGWLQKRGEKHQAWRRRYFRLEGGTRLVYYEKAPKVSSSVCRCVNVVLTGLLSSS
jgi:PH domain